MLEDDVSFNSRKNFCNQDKRIQPETVPRKLEEKTCKGIDEPNT